MAAGDPYLECDQAGKLVHDASGVEEILNALHVVDDDGNHGLRAVISSKSAGVIEQAVPCGDANLALEWILKNILVEAASGKPAIRLITEA